jgi:hypothetical protein
MTEVEDREADNSNSGRARHLGDGGKSLGLDPDNDALLIRHDDGDDAASVGEEADEGDPSEGGRRHGGGRDDPSETESEDDDDDEGTIYTHSFREAADLLEESNEELQCLCVHPSEDEEEDDEAENEEEDEAISFRRIVSALGRRVVRQIVLHDMGWEGVWEDDVERLCRVVLPTHPTLEEVAVDMPSPFVGLLASSIRAGGSTPLRKLELRGYIDHDSAQAIADMIGRKVPLSKITLYPPGSLGADECKCICRAVVASGNTNLRSLELSVKEAFAETLDRVVTASTLRVLAVAARNLSDEFIVSLTKQLRTNTTIEHLRVYRFTLTERPDDAPGRGSQGFRYIEETLETYNFTLRKVLWLFSLPNSAKERIERRILMCLLRRNRRIRRALRQLEPRGFHLDTASLWPHALGMVSPLPTLVYRFLRRGNAIDLLRPDDGSMNVKKRGRPARSDDGDMNK